MELCGPGCGYQSRAASAHDQKVTMLCFHGFVLSYAALRLRCRS